MNRGRTPARGTRRGAAAAGQRAPAATGESSAGPSTAPAASTAASGSTTPAIRSASTRGAAVARATRGATVGRFRPKNIRRDEAEREELARQEEQKAREREADERRARGRSRFRSKRSRGDAMGRGGFGRIISGASGPFSSGVAGGSGGGGWFGGGGGGGNFGSGGGFGRGFKSESKPGFAQADGSRFREARINADKLHVHTPEEELDSEDEAMMNVLSTRAPSVLPMGIYRKEHKEEGVVVATTAELEAAENAQNAPAAAGEEESLWVDDDAGAGEAQAADQGEEGTWTDSKPIIKKEPGDDSIDMDIKVKPAEEKTPAEETAKPKSKKATAQELEDKFADLDLALLRSELGSIEVAEGEGEDGKKAAPSNKDGRLYLFRFPPIMPPLKQVSQPKPASKVKPEPTEANVLESTPAATDANPVDLTLEDLVSSGLNNGADDPENKHGFMPSLMTQGGMIGQLKVRKSGRTTLDWGGLLLDMGSSPDPGFLTTAVIVEENDEKPRPGVVGGESFGMGKIMGRFGLAPFWDEEEDWEVSPEELKIT